MRCKSLEGKLKRESPKKTISISDGLWLLHFLSLSRCNIPNGMINEAFSSCRSLPTQLTVIMQHLNLLQLQWQPLQGKRERES